MQRDNKNNVIRLKSKLNLNILGINVNLLS